MRLFRKREDHSERIRELETRLRILSSQILIKSTRASGLHARDNKFFAEYVKVVDELEELSAVWRDKDILHRRSKK